MILTTILVAIIIFLITYAFLTHPDSHGMPPGPTGWPIIGSVHRLVNKHAFTALQEFAKEWGDVCSVRFGSRRVVVLSSAQAIQQAFVKQGDVFNHRPTGTLLSKVLQGRGVVGSEGDLWREHRRFLLQVMRDFGLGKRTMEDNVTQEAKELVNQIQQKLGQPYDPHQDLATAVTNIVWSVTAGERYEWDDPKLKWMVETLEYNLAQIDLAGPLNYFPWLQMVWLPLRANLPTMLGKMFDLQKYFTSLVTNHKESFKEELRHSDIIHAYVGKQKDFEAEEVASSFTDRQIQTVVSDLFIAGIDTTMTALRWAMLHLAMHPECQKKASQEVKAVFGDEFPSFEKRTKTPYLEAVIHETLRWSTIAPIVQHSNPVECSLNGYRIPKRTWIIANLWAANRDEKLWPEPEKFNPERFLNEEGKLQGVEKVVTFSAGRRSCLGESLARLELYIILAAILQKFKWTNNPSSPQENKNGKLGVTWSPDEYEIVVSNV